MVSAASPRKHQTAGNTRAAAGAWGGKPLGWSPGLPRSLPEGAQAGIGEGSEWVWVGQRLGDQEGEGEDEEWTPSPHWAPW